MDPTVKDIEKDLDEIKQRIDLYGNEEIDDDEKIALSKRLAFVVEEIRRKYKLTSAYYFYAEGTARKYYEEKYGEGFK